MNPDSFIGGYTTAAQGALLLDRNVQDWYMKVDPETLDQGDGKACVLAQLYGEYLTGLDRMRLAGSHPAFDGKVPASDWVEEIKDRLVARMYQEKRNSDVEMKPGKTYRFTVEAKYSSSSVHFHHFRDDIGNLFIFSKEHVTNVEEVNTHEVRSGDVYLRDGVVYQVSESPVGGLWVVVPGLANRTRVENYNFTEAELIYRKDS